MGTGRTLNKKPATRPVKSEGERRRRQKVQKARLVKLGMEAPVVAKLDPAVVRKILRKPAKAVKAIKADKPVSVK